MGAQKHQPKNDKYKKARGGSSQFLDIYCGKCNTHLCLYQKDGPGNLLRLYADRIFEPASLAEHSSAQHLSDLPTLTCSKCGQIIAHPIVYEPESRLAFRIVGAIKKQRSDGSYPPLKQQR